MASSIAPANVKSGATPRYDVWLILATCLLLLVGLMSQYSLQVAGQRYLARHTMMMLVGLIPFTLFLLVKTDWLSRFSTRIYIFSNLLLLMVLQLGENKGGAQRWIDVGPVDLQPSELAKLLSVISLAAYYARNQDRITERGVFIGGLLHMALPAGLIFAQPHLGGSMVIFVTWLGISVAAGISWRPIILTLLALLGMLAFAFFTPGILRDYQKERVIGLVFPDEKDNGYQGMKARLAFGAGGLTGTGFTKGEHTKLGAVPEQQTDYVLTVIGEEGGLFGCTLLLAMFSFFFYRVWIVMHQALDPFHRLVATGIFSVLAFHAAVNMGMVLGVLPVVGLWLPFVSYGGTAMWLCLASVGLLLNIRKSDQSRSF